MDFHEEKRKKSMKDVLNRLEHIKSIEKNLMGNHNSISGGLLRENFGYAQKILKQRADDIDKLGSTAS
jgi:hypothetical protein